MKTDDFFDPERHEAMMNEWRAWRIMCRVLGQHGINVNEDTDGHKRHEVIAAIASWGYRQTLLHDLIPDHDGKPMFHDAEVEVKMIDQYFAAHEETQGGTIEQDGTIVA